MPKQYTNIYGLYDERKLVDGDLDSIRYRYVGKSDHPLDRLKEHIHNALHKGVKYPVYDWIRKLDKEGVRPQMLILHDDVPMESWQREERSMIATLRAAGHDLLNVAEGGEGRSSEEWKRIHADPEVKAKHAAATSAGMTRRYEDPAAHAKTSAAGKRRFEDPAERAKSSAAQKRPEVKARQLAGMKRTWAPCSARRVKLGRRNVMKSMLRRYVVALEQFILVARREVMKSMLRRYELCQMS